MKEQNQLQIWKQNYWERTLIDRKIEEIDRRAHLRDIGFIALVRFRLYVCYKYLVEHKSRSNNKKRKKEDDTSVCNC